MGSGHLSSKLLVALIGILRFDKAVNVHDPQAVFGDLGLITLALAANLAKANRIGLPKVSKRKILWLQWSWGACAWSFGLPQKQILSHCFAAHNWVVA